MRSLSARLLVFTVLFVMLAEVLIFVPSVSRFRHDWLVERLALAHLAILTLEVAQDGTVDDRLRAELLHHVGAYGIGYRRNDAKMVLMQDMPPPIQETVDLSRAMFPELIIDALVTLVRGDARVIRVVGPSPKDERAAIEVVIDERPLTLAMIEYGWRIFLLSIVISLITAMLVYFSLQWIMVRPMRRLTESMTAFREEPEDASRIIVPSSRQDEIGVAQRELESMQKRLREALRQRAHLAALGTTVAKVNHDLRGILSSALLVSDRLEGSDDPQVRQVTPTIVSAIERAVRLCSDTLDYARREQPRLERTRFALAPLIYDVGLALGADDADGAFAVDNRVAPELEVVADRDQLFRVLTNLARNAAEAGACTMVVAASVEGARLDIRVRDDGPGIPARAREKLFQPFAGSVRAGGTGLGLPIARELLRDHGGDLSLVRSDVTGTEFQLDLPAPEP